MLSEAQLYVKVQSLAKAQQYIKDTYNGELLEYKNVNSYAKFKCINDHIFTKSYCAVSQGFWCIECKKNIAKKVFYDKLKNIIESKGGKCLFTEYVDHTSKFNIQCEINHTFTSTYRCIMIDKSWCSHCSKTAKLSIDVAKNIAIERKGECLSTEYKNHKGKLEWKCYYGHVWKTCLSHIKNNNSWCPQCNINIGEEITRNILNVFKK